MEVFRITLGESGAQFEITYTNEIWYATCVYSPIGYIPTAEDANRAISYGPELRSIQYEEEFELITFPPTPPQHYYDEPVGR